MKYDHLDTSSFMEIFQKAQNHWRYKTGNEEDHPSDVSYTLLEMMAMLIDMLNYYMEQVSSAHERCYQNLLDEHTAKQTPSFPLFIHPKLPQHILAGQLFYGQKGYEAYCFEAKQATTISPVEISAIYYKDADYHQRIDHLLRQKEGVYQLPLTKKQGELILLLREKLDKHDVHTLYVRCEEERRNPKGAYFSFAEVELSYYTDKGWMKGSILEDQTWNFLYSGCIRICMDMDMQKVEYEYAPAYALRFVFHSAQYDCLPSLRELQCAAIEVQAQRHISRTYDRWFTHDGESCLQIEEDISGMEISVLKEDKRTTGVYHEVPYEIQKQNHGWHIDAKIRTYPVHIRVLCTRPHEYETLYQGVTSQIILLPDCTLDMVMIKTPSGYREVPCYDILEEAPYGYGCWKKEKELQFGNGRDFKIMESGRLWYGNLIEYGIKERKEVFTQQSNIQFDIPKVKPIPRLCETIRTKEDVVAACKQMPTFAIDEVVAIAGEDTWEIYVHNPCEQYPNGYFQQIEEYLDPYMMIGIQVKAAMLHRIPVDIIMPSAFVSHKETIRKELLAFLNADVRQLTKADICRICKISMDQLTMIIAEEDVYKKNVKEDECFYLRQITFL